MKISTWSVEISARSSSQEPGQWELQPWQWLAELSLSKVGKGAGGADVSHSGEKLHPEGEERMNHMGTVDQWVWSKSG